MLYLSAVFLITICSLLHDSDNPAVFITKRYGEKYGKWFGKWFVVALHGVVIYFIARVAVDNDLIAVIASLTSVGIFWGIFRRGSEAKAELTAIRLKDEPSINAITKAYPLYLGYVPKYITIGVLILPFPSYYRRIQSGLIALLWTGHISSLPVLVLGAM